MKISRGPFVGEQWALARLKFVWAFQNLLPLCLLGREGTAKGRLSAYILNINTGEDVFSQILSFSKFGCQAICTILSATGILSRVTIIQPGHPYEVANFEGCFEIISLSGSITAGKIIGHPQDGGMFNTLLGNSDGEVFGGLAGSLIAAVPIQSISSGIARTFVQLVLIAIGLVSIVGLMLCALFIFQIVCGGLEKETNQKPKSRRRAKSFVAASMPGNLKAKKITTTITSTSS